MSIGRNIIAAEGRSIPYRPEFNQFTGSVISSILLKQIVYWDSIFKGKPFYKFKAKCNHNDYRQGDSWTEELGFTKSQFDTALKKISQKITKGSDKNHDVLVWYWTDISRRTYYQLNHRLFDEKILKIYGQNRPLEQTEPKIKKVDLRKEEKLIYVNKESGFTKSGNPDLYITEITKDYQENNKKVYKKDFEVIDKSLKDSQDVEEDIPRDQCLNIESKVEDCYRRYLKHSRNAAIKRLPQGVGEEEFITYAVASFIDSKLGDMLPKARERKVRTLAAETVGAWMTKNMHWMVKNILESKQGPQMSAKDRRNNSMDRLRQAQETIKEQIRERKRNEKVT